MTFAPAIPTMRSCRSTPIAAEPTRRPHDPLTHYVIVRADLPVGFLAAQIVHAAGESAPGPVPTDTNAVVLSVPDEAALVAVERRLRDAGLPVHAVHEPDAPWCGALTALALPPAPRSAHRRYLSSLPLLGGLA